MKDEVEQWSGEYSAADWTSEGYKKFQDAIVSGKVRSERVAIRFNSSTAKFGAAFLGVTFESRDYKALIACMGVHLSTREVVAFTRMIKVDYDRTFESRRTSIGGKSWGDRGHEERPISGLRLEFDVFDVSEPFAVQWASGPNTARVWRRLGKPGSGDWIVEAEDTQSTEVHDLDGMFEFTEHRYQALLAIKAALAALDDRLESLFGEAAGARTPTLLDRLDGMTLLLAAGGIDEYMKPTARRRERRKR